MTTLPPARNSANKSAHSFGSNDLMIDQTSETGHCLIIASTLHDFNLVFLPIYNFSSFIFIFDFQEMGGGG
jgi:hypothetical protein